MRGVRGQAAVVQLCGAALPVMRQAADLVPVQGAGTVMAEGIGCAICGSAAVSRRIDLTDSDVNPRDLGDYAVRGVLRGVLICPECITKRGIASLLNLRGGVELVRGCMVQCGGNAPRHLRWVLPGGVRMWTKTVCPCCQGRATVQIIADVVERPEPALWRAVKDAFALLSLRRHDSEWDEEDAADVRLS